MKIAFSNTNDHEDSLWVNSPNSLNIIADDGEATEIMVDDILHSFSLKEVENILQLIASKIKKGGKLILYLTDIELLSHMLTTGSITFNDFNDCFFHSGQSIKSFISSDFIFDILNRLGFKINQKQIKNFTLIIVGTLE